MLTFARETSGQPIHALTGTVMHQPSSQHFSSSSPVRTIVFIIGTRPEVIKVAPIIKRLRASSWAVPRIITSGQQSDLLSAALSEFGLTSDHAIPHEKASHTPAHLVSYLISRLDQLLEQERPDCVIAQGDTTTAYAASLAAFYRQTPFVHIEAGLRTNDLSAPFPEEFHRRAIAVSAFLHCAPTSAAANNLIRENVSPERIIVSGNTVIDALLETAATKPLRPRHYPGGRTILLTAHRRENFGAPLREAFTAVRAFVDVTPDVSVFFPVHPNPNARAAAQDVLSDHPRIKLVDPLGYRDMVAALQNAWCIVTDSGGLQEEAPALGKPVLVLRDVTERPEAIASGVVELVGTAKSAVFRALYELDTSPQKHARMSRSVFPYGDGHASMRIVEALRRHFELPARTIESLQFDLQPG